MRKLLLLNISLTFLLIVWGGVVRNFDAGLACPDWPLCHGKIVPPLDPLIWIEWGHRLLASIVGVITLILAFSYRKKMGFVAFLPVALVIVQALLGGMTVKGILAPHWVSLHLAVGLLYFAALLWLFLRVEELDGERKIFDGDGAGGAGRGAAPLEEGGGCPPSDRTRASEHQEISSTRALGNNTLLRHFCLVATLTVYLQAVLGAVVASTGAGLACPDFPTCYGAWLPELHGGVALQFFHRVGALLVMLISLFLVWLSFRHSSERCHSSESWNPFFKRRVFLIFILTLLQVGLGISNVLFRLPEILSILHLAVATLLFANFAVLSYKVRHASIPQFDQTAN